MGAGAGEVGSHYLDVTSQRAYDELGKDAETGWVGVGCSDRASPTGADHDELSPHEVRACAGCPRCHAPGGAAQGPAAEAQGGPCCPS